MSIDTNEMYFRKYMKYKTKYIELKNTVGGSDPRRGQSKRCLLILAHSLRDFYKSRGLEDKIEKLTSLPFANKTIEMNDIRIQNGNLYYIKDYNKKTKDDDVALRYERIMRTIMNMKNFIKLVKDKDPQYKVLSEVSEHIEKLKDIIKTDASKWINNSAYTEIMESVKEILDSADLYQDLNKLYSANKKSMRVLNREVSALMKNLRKNIAPLMDIMHDDYMGFIEENKTDYQKDFWVSYWGCVEPIVGSKFFLDRWENSMEPYIELKKLAALYSKMYDFMRQRDQVAKTAVLKRQLEAEQQKANAAQTRAAQQKANAAQTSAAQTPQ